MALKPEYKPTRTSQNNLIFFPRFVSRNLQGKVVNLHLGMEICLKAMKIPMEI